MSLMEEKRKFMPVWLNGLEMNYYDVVNYSLS